MGRRPGHFKGDARREFGAYGKPEVCELNGSTACGILPEVAPDWERLVACPGFLP